MSDALIRNSLLCCFVLSGVLAAAPAQPARPPDGTYTYTTFANGAAVFVSTVVVESGADVAAFTVTESAKLSADKEALVKTSYDASTVLPTHYELHNKALGSVTVLDAVIDRASAKFEGIPLSYSALSGSKFMLIGEGLSAYRVMMPWSVLANGSQDFTLAALNGNKTIQGKVIAATEPRPAGVAAADTALAMQIGTDAMTAWYNPQTHFTDQVDVAGGVSTRLVKYSPTIDKLVAPAVVALPLPPAKYREHGVTIASAGAVLSGTLAIPGNAKRYPAIVFVHGSGPGTRDGGVQANPTFLALGNALANNGVAVLRYDKRGIGQSTGTATEDWRILGGDVRAAVAYLRTQPQIDPSRIFVLGHSEGGFVVPAVANKMPVRGIVTMGAPSITLQKILVKQGIATMTASQQKMLGDAFAPYSGIDPPDVFKAVKVPMLLIQGGKDAQALASDFARVAAAVKASHRRATIVILPQDDHFFIRLPDSQPMQAGEFLSPHELDPRLPAAILNWIKQLR